MRVFELQEEEETQNCKWNSNCMRQTFFFHDESFQKSGHQMVPAHKLCGLVFLCKCNALFDRPHEFRLELFQAFSFVFCHLTDRENLLSACGTELHL